MLKKILTLSILYICSFWVAGAFLWEDAWLNLYKDIEKWLENLEAKNFEYELNWWWKSAWEEVNRLLELEWLDWCIKNNISVEDIKNIAVNNKVSTLYDFIDTSNWNCVDGAWDFELDILNKTIGTIKIIYEASRI